MLRFLRLLALLGVLSLGLAYTCRTPGDPLDPGDPPVTDPVGFVVDATVEFLPLEGGCWTLRASDGTRYEPVGLSDDFRVDGLSVRAALKRRADIGSFCMVGAIVEVLWMRRP